MTNPITRRKWLNQTTRLALGGAALGGGLSIRGTAANPRPYQLPAASRIRLSMNENPYGPSPKALQAMAEAFGESCRYSFQLYPEFRELIASHEGVGVEHVLIGAGSSEILGLAALAFGLQGGEMVAARPTFRGLIDYALNLGVTVHEVPLDTEFRHDLEAMEGRVNRNTRLVFVCNPNNPTGTIVEATGLDGFCDRVSKRAVILVDEAYHDYAPAPQYRSMTEWVRRDRNVIVSRTFSKIHGMAGLRVGYALAPPEIIERLERYVMSPGNTLALKAAMVSYQDHEFVSESLRRSRESLEVIYGTLRELGYPFVPSYANFVFFSPGRPVLQFRSEMEERGIEIGRPFPPYQDWCRMSLGTVEEMERCSQVMRELAEVADRPRS